ncbi:hypothetical protein [Synechococcus sp. CBW1107]|uniref:hypothetical protein n=1 Tax=Synechococcus sp. CBW1107 TaxID=2789857 RepID=UPI002AD358F2|nr:hypothetical protein [Synechococcus sp. CBW1107]
MRAIEALLASESVRTDRPAVRAGLQLMADASWAASSSSRLTETQHWQVSISTGVAAGLGCSTVWIDPVFVFTGTLLSLVLTGTAVGGSAVLLLLVWMVDRLAMPILIERMSA